MTEARPERGPYVEENGPDFWLPTDAWTWNEARAEAARHAHYECHGVSRYLGKEVTGDHDDWDTLAGCCQREAYHFTSEERW
jgi:hypothetical protein